MEVMDACIVAMDACIAVLVVCIVVMDACIVAMDACIAVLVVCIVLIDSVKTFNWTDISSFCKVGTAPLTSNITVAILAQNEYRSASETSSNEALANLECLYFTSVRYSSASLFR